MASVAAPEGARSTVDLMLRGRRADVRGRVFQALLLLTLLAALAVLLLLLWTTWAKAYPVFRERGLGFVTSNLSALPQSAGVRQGVIGSFVLIAFVALIAIPLGISASIYLQEYARDTRLNRLLITNIRNLAGVPSIVYGILGFAVFARLLRSVTGPGGGQSGLSAVSGGLTLAVLVMPIVILVTMEALRAVPRSIREAAYGVGATRWEVVRSHVLPYAAPGIFTGTILSLARAFGETAPLLMVGAVTGYLTPSGDGLLESLRGFKNYTALPTEIFSFSRQIGPEWQANAAAAIIVLLSVILAVNAVAIVLRNRYERTW
jgi:phosphate transport system permease protein